MAEIKLCSFSYKLWWQELPDEYRVIDCRNLPNPHRVKALRDLDGMYRSVQDYIVSTPEFVACKPTWLQIAKTDRSVAFGCHGGRHRSVAVAEMLKRELEAEGHGVTVHHRDLRRS
jgi:UPF0042 nucleotide-binding protein